MGGDVGISSFGGGVRGRKRWAAFFSDEQAKFGQEALKQPAILGYEPAC